MERIVLETVQWQRLLDIDDVAPISDDDHAVLDEIGELLRRHGKAERFGVCLLHKHFELGPEEALVEDTDPVKRISTLRPLTGVALMGKTIETMWRFPEGRETVTECVKRCVYNFGHPNKHVKEGR